MKKTFRYIIYTIAGLGISFVSSASAFASEVAQAGSTDYTKAIVIAACSIAAALSITVAALGVGIGMGNATGNATQSVSRNPDASGKVMLAMIVGMAMTESIAIYALVISLLILYANPLLKYIAG